MINSKNIFIINKKHPFCLSSEHGVTVGLAQAARRCEEGSVPRLTSAPPLTADASGPARSPTMPQPHHLPAGKHVNEISPCHLV